MIINLRVWRQPNAQTPGQMVSYRVEDVSSDMSFLEMLDVLNERQGVDALADLAGTIGYEILTSLGSRYPRTYR